MMLSVVVDLIANEVRALDLSGTYFELRVAPAMVDQIELLDRSGGVVSIMDDAEATDFVRTSRAFEKVRITNGATPQAIKFYYGEGDAGSNRFTGVVSGSVALDAGTLAALESVSLNTATLEAIQRGESSTAFTNLGTAVGTGNEVVVAPGTNVNGLVLLTASAYGYTTIVDQAAALVAKSSAPASPTDGEALVQFLPVTMNAANMYWRAELLRPVYVPAGLGLYWARSFGFALNQQRITRYKLL